MSHTLTLPDSTAAHSAQISDLKRNLKDLAWTGNAGNGRFHFCFTSAADCTIAGQRLKSLQA
jgi:hypothetical protein